MRQPKFTFWWSDRMSMLLNENYLQSFIIDKDFLSNHFNNIVFAVNNRLIDFYVSTKELEEAKLIGYKKFINQKFTIKYFNQLDRELKKFWQNIKKIAGKNHENLNLKELIKDLEKFNTSLMHLWQYFKVSQAEFFYLLEEELLSRLLKKDGPLLANKFFMELITPVELDMVNKEHTDWVKLLAKPFSKKLLITHLTKYPAIFRNVWEKEKMVKLLIEKYKSDKKNLRQLNKEVENLLKEKRELKKKQSLILKRYDDKVAYLSWLFQKWGVKRFDVKYGWAGVEIYLENFFKEISKRIKVNFYDLMWFYRKEEIIEALANNIKLSKNEIQRRKKFFLFYIINNKLIFLSGAKAFKKSRQLLKNSLPKKETKKITGQIANTGKAVGSVKIIRCGDSSELKKGFRKFKTGDVLVTEMTQVEMVPLVKKAAAIITDEGGIISHAAVVSREFKIPCIVGTHLATKILKDGDKVKVDADKGTIKKLG